MMNFITKLKIPTVLGLGVILAGTVAGVYLNLQEQVFLSRAAPNLTPQNITVANITDTSVAISWETNSEGSSFITYGQNNPGEQTTLDDRDNGTPQPHSTHYVTLKNLLPKTAYQYKIISGKITSDVEKFETAQPLTNQTEFAPVIGTVLDDNKPLEDGVVYLAIPEAAIQSALVKIGGNFLIPLSQIRKTDLSDYQLAEGLNAKLTIRSDKGEANMLFKLKATSSPLPPIKIGQSIDLATPEETPVPTPNENLGKYDLNGDGKINAADYAILSACFSKRTSLVLPGKISCTKADLNEDEVINQKDLELMNQKFKELGVPAVESQ
ncbi:MAG: fibronectin type III domain-containing protein [Patescibacteria group bacterium]|nr:fibronectin type III domain-containing protein [Patescibacteria group bacterium]